MNLWRNKNTNKRFYKLRCTYSVDYQTIVYILTDSLYWGYYSINELNSRSKILKIIKKSLYDYGNFSFEDIDSGKDDLQKVETSKELAEELTSKYFPELL